MAMQKQNWYQIHDGPELRGAVRLSPNEVEDLKSALESVGLEIREVNPGNVDRPTIRPAAAQFA